MKQDRNDEKQFGRKPFIQGDSQSQKPGEKQPKRRKNQCKIQEVSYLSEGEENSNSILIHSNSAEIQDPEEIIDYGQEKIKDDIKQQPLQDFSILRNKPMVNSEMEEQYPRQVKIQLKDPKIQTEAMQIKEKEKKPLGYLHQSKQIQSKAPKQVVHYDKFQHISIIPQKPNPPKQAEEDLSEESMAEVSQITQKMEQQINQFQNISIENYVKEPLQFCKGLRSTLKYMYKGFYLTRLKVKQLYSRLKKYQSRKLNETKSEHLEKGIKKQRKRRRASQIQRRFRCEFTKCQKGYGSSSSLSNHVHKKHKHELLSKMKKDKKQSRLLQREIIDLSKRHEKEEEVDSFDNKPDNRFPRHYRYPPANKDDEIFEE